MGRILALDHGSKRIGLSISDDLKMIAQILEPVLDNDEKLWKRLSLIIKKYEIEKVIVGHAISMKGGEEKAARLTKSFAEEIQRKTKIEAELVDERLTTVQAENLLKEQGLSQSAHKQIIDNQAAQIILQQYLDAK